MTLWIRIEDLILIFLVSDDLFLQSGSYPAETSIVFGVLLFFVC